VGAKRVLDSTPLWDVAGTDRLGTDPGSSVVDVPCQAHELDNLYLVDSSFFVSIGEVNPTLTLTLIANAPPGRRAPARPVELRSLDN
jgi:choline dehydrogenase-like flavoprotein